MSEPTANALYYGDCLDWMGRWDDASVDLIYLDPPFNSQATYNMLYGQAAGSAAPRSRRPWGGPRTRRSWGYGASSGNRGCWPICRTWRNAWSTASGC